MTVCRGYMPTYEDRGDDSRLWGMNRLFRWTTYDAFDFTTRTDNKETKLKGRANAWVWRPGSWAEASYDTFDSVDNIDSGEGIDPSGTIQIVEVTAGGIGRDAKELLRKLKAAQYVAAHPGEVCPAAWKEGAKTLAPSLDLVGKI